MLDYLFRIIDQTEQREYIIDQPLYSIVRLLISMSDRLNCLYNITQKPHDTTVNYKKLVFNQVKDEEIGEVSISTHKTCFDQYLEQKYMF